MNYRIVEAGDSVLVVEFEERIDVTVNARAVALADHLRMAQPPGVRDIVPTFRSVAVYFDPLKTDVEALVGRLNESVNVEPPPRPPAPPVRIPVCYGGSFGPDLAEVAAYADITESAVIELHAQSTYRVFMLGFLPGFAYMGSVDRRIAAPRRSSPRVRIAAGSVGIAGEQTGIYPTDSPGGWQLIGRTPVKPFDVRRAAPFLFAAGDSVQFYPVEAAEFERLAIT